MLPPPTWVAWTEGRNCMRCDSVPTRKCMHGVFCTWFSVNWINFERLNYLRFKLNPNILPPWVGGWVIVSECVCVCVCVCVKWNFKTKVCFCNLFCWRQLHVSKMGSENAKFLSLKLTSTSIVREVFSKITKSNLAIKNIFVELYFMSIIWKLEDNVTKIKTRMPKFHEFVLIKPQAQPWRYKYFRWIRVKISADL